MKVLILTKAFVSHVNSDFLKENWMGDLSGVDVFSNRFVVPFASWKLLNWIFFQILRSSQNGEVFFFEANLGGEHSL